MTSPVSETIELIAKAMEGATPGLWYVCEFKRPNAYHVRSERRHWSIVSAMETEGCSTPSMDVPDAEARANAAYIEACSPDRMREVLAAAREAEALTGIGSAHDLISDWLGEGTDDLPDDTPVRIEIGKRTIIGDTIGSLRRARALLSKESADAAGSSLKSSGTGGGE